MNCAYSEWGEVSTRTRGIPSRTIAFLGDAGLITYFSIIAKVMIRGTWIRPGAIEPTQPLESISHPVRADADKGVPRLS